MDVDSDNDDDGDRRDGESGLEEGADWGPFLRSES